MSADEIINLTAETAAYMAIVHPDYTMLANRVSVQGLHKKTHDDIAECAKKLYAMTDKVGRPAPLLSDKVYQLILDNREKINAHIDYSRDFNYDFFGFKTLEKSYLLRVDGQVAERPQ